MKISIWLTSLLFFSSIPCFAQQKRSEPGCCAIISGKNALTNLIMSEAGNKNPKSFSKRYYGIDPLDSLAEVSGVMKLRGGSLSDKTLRYFESVSKVSGRIYTFSVQLNNLLKLEQNDEIEYISLSRIAEKQMGQAARKDAGFDKVHNGESLPMPYTGKGILCGLVDVGFDYTHPAFKNETGDSLRIIRAWAQNLKRGTPPVNTRYGVEFIGTSALLAAGSDSLTSLHATITTGSMAAGGYGSAGLYTGAAPASQIIAVTSNNSEKSLLDAMNYFFTNAGKLNKRGVFNLSWGSQIGPHDGTSLFDQAIDSLVKEGGLIVGAAGNWADDIIHLKHLSGSSLNTTSTVVLQWDTVRYSIIDLWGKPNSSFQVQVKAIDKVTGNTGVATTTVSTQRQGQSSFNLVFGKDTTTVYMVMTAKDVNNSRPNCLVAFLHNHVTTNTNLSLHITSLNNEVHAWGANSAIFSDKTEKDVTVPNFNAGDNQYTIGELGGTSKSIITAGAHVSQQKYTNYFGAERYFAADSGKIEPFSSLGPTLDGRIKPDLTAPGSVLVPVNSFSFDIDQTPERVAVLEKSSFDVNGQTYYWLGDEATSFAAPVVSGSIALLLEADPTLNFNQVKNALLKNTTTDNYTGNVGLTGSTQWGFGKLNIHKAISSISTLTGSDTWYSKQSFWYSNPVQNVLSLFSSESDAEYELEICDIYGKMLINKAPGLIRKENSFLYYDTSSLNTGQYIVTLKSKTGLIRSLKLIKI